MLYNSCLLSPYIQKTCLDSIFVQAYQPCQGFSMVIFFQYLYVTAPAKQNIENAGRVSLNIIFLLRQGIKNGC